MVAAAIIGGAVVGGVGTAIAGSKAAGATKDASNAAINQQQQALQQQATLSQPYRDIATGGAIDQYKNLLGIGTQGQAGIQASLEATPGYQFTKQQGLQSTQNAASASGMALSGNTLQALDKYSSGLADTTYQQQLGNSLNAVQLGQAAAAGQAANIGNAASNTGNILMNQGNTMAGIDANTAAGIAKTIGGATNQLVTNQTLQGLSSPGFTPDPKFFGSNMDFPTASPLNIVPSN